MRSSTKIFTKIINRLYKRLKQKYGPHHRSFKTKLMPLRDNVHFKDETYMGLSSEIENFAISAFRMDRVNPYLLLSNSNCQYKVDCEILCKINPFRFFFSLFVLLSLLSQLEAR